MPPITSRVGPFEVRYYPRPHYLPPNSFTFGVQPLNRGAEPIGVCYNPEDPPSIPPELGTSHLYPYHDQRDVTTTSSFPVCSTSYSQQRSRFGILSSPVAHFRLQDSRPDTSSTRARPSTSAGNDPPSVAEGRSSSDTCERQFPLWTRSELSPHHRGHRNAWVRNSTSTNGQPTRGRGRSYSHRRTSRSNSGHQGQDHRRRTRIYSISTAESDNCDAIPSTTQRLERRVGVDARLSPNLGSPLPAQRPRGRNTKRILFYDMVPTNGGRSQSNNHHSNDSSSLFIPAMSFQEAFSILDDSVTKVLNRLPPLIKDFREETKALDYLEPKILDEIWKQKVQALKRRARQSNRNNGNESGRPEGNSNDGGYGGGSGSDGLGQGQDGGGNQEGNDNTNRGHRRNAGDFSIHELQEDLAKLAGSINEAQTVDSPPSYGRALMPSAVDLTTLEEVAGLERRCREERRVAEFRKRTAPSMWRIQDRLNDKGQAVLSNVDMADELWRDCEALLDILRRDAEFWNKGAGDQREQIGPAGGHDGGRRGQ